VGLRNRSFDTPLAPLALLVGVVFGLAVLPKPSDGGPTPLKLPPGRAVGHITTQERAATFTFAPTLAPADRNAILTAVAHARPEVQALIAAIDGLVDVRVGHVPNASGMANPMGDRFHVSLDLGMVSRAAGQRGLDMLVLHELGHVVDFALVPPALDAQLDAGIPQGYGCDDGYSGGCAPMEERFADSFAKWATGDIGVNLPFGYKVPPPNDLANWGAPLATLASGGS
jgi:hypothetical protein